MAEPCKCGNKPLAYTKGEKLIHKLSLGPGIRIMDVVKKMDILYCLSQKPDACNTEQMPRTFQLFFLQAMSACPCSCHCQQFYYFLFI
jgi:hypothetical protein